MSYFRHLINSKGSANLLRRALMIYKRFGLTGAKSRGALQQLLEITDRHNCKPTLFITADLLDHHAEVIRSISSRNVDVALHGHHHVDHAFLEGSVQLNEISKGVEKFRKNGIKVSGFRGPFLRFNEDTAKAVAASELSWTSHTVMLFHDNICSDEITRSNSVKHLLEFYTQKSHALEPSIPCWGSHCLEIPVSLPDDEILIDRLGITGSSRITEVWLDMLNTSRQQGELFNVILHPERMDLLAKPLDILLETAVSQGDVWIASMNDINRWWNERSTCAFKIAEGGNGDTYQVSATGSPRVKVALHEPGGIAKFLSIEEDGTITIQSSLRPVIGLSAGFCDKGAPCLINEGFVVESDGVHSRNSFTLDGVCSRNRRALLESIEIARESLPRLWRWPEGFKSALAITADVDAINFWDFVRRAHHFRKTKSAHKSRF